MSDDLPIDPLLDPPEEPPVDPPAGLPPRRARRQAPTRGRSERLAGQRAPGPRTTSARPASARAKSPSALRRRLTVSFVVLAVVLGALAFGVWSTLYRASSDVPAGRTVSIVIPKGASGATVASILADSGVVANPTMFRLRASALGLAGAIKAGSYSLKTGSPYDDVVHLLTRGPVVELITVTIPEGWGIPAVAARMFEKLGIPEQEFIDLATTGAKKFDFAFLADDPTPSLEGYLFPKTYDFKRGVKATDVIKVMLAQYGKETAGIDYSYARSKKLTPHDVLAIASIIEREAQVPKDRPNVASVIYNRLAIGMRLQLDSTVQYALHGKVKLTLDDLKVDDPYNTYVYIGVPPGPICSPGMSAISAAAHPAITKYIYYILTHKDGSQSFATNYADFLKLKAQFKKGLQ